MLGSGSFGTAMGVVIARNGFNVVVHCRREEVAASINANHRNPNYLTEYTLPDNLTATTNATDCLKGVAFVVHAVPIQSTFAYLNGIKEHIPTDAIVVSTSKGLQSDSLAMMYELIPAALGRKQPTAFVSGPSFVSRDTHVILGYLSALQAKELVQGQPTGLVVASEDLEIAKRE